MHADPIMLCLEWKLAKWLKYVTMNLNLWGIKNPETVVIEGHNQYPDRSQDIVAEGLAKVAETAAKF